MLGWENKFTVKLRQKSITELYCGKYFISVCILDKVNKTDIYSSHETTLWNNFILP